MRIKVLLVRGYGRAGGASTNTPLLLVMPPHTKHSTYTPARIPSPDATARVVLAVVAPVAYAYQTAAAARVQGRRAAQAQSPRSYTQAYSTCRLVAE